MKLYKSISVLFLSLIILTSCEHNVSLETTVHEDGSLDKVVVYENKDSSNSIAKKPSKDILGIAEKHDWQQTVKIKEKEEDSIKSKTHLITYTKRFASAEEANAELAIPNDSLFQITSKFEKRFRWFYTYITYSETFHSLNKMKLKPDDYLTPEDYSFIDRLPAEGKKISKADNFYLGELNKRIFDIYGMRAFYEEFFALHVELIEKNNLEKKWADTLAAHKEDIFELLENRKDLPEDYVLTVMDSLKIPLDYKKAKAQYNALYKALSTKTDFITTANDGKYINRVNLPWDIVISNADSVSGNSLFWAPPTIKFLLKDYTMHGECRKLNWWAVIVSVLFVGFTGYLIVRKRAH